MKPNSQSKSYGKPNFGCYFDHANYNNDELNRRIIRLAAGFGRVDAEDDELAAVPLVELTDEQSETLNYSADAAIDWLNEQETRPFMYWANEGEANAFGLWINVDGAKEDCGFVSSRKQESPDADFIGEWLSVSDHGNVTLYIRNADGSDTEVWSIV